MASPTLYRPIKEGLINALLRVFSQGDFSDQVLDFTFKSQRKWGARDRRIFAQTLYGVVRWLRPLAHQRGLAWEESWAPRSEGSLTAQFSGAKKFTADDWSEVIECWLEDQERVESETCFSEYDGEALRYSLSDYLLQLFREQTAEGLRELPSLNKEAPVFLRCNPLKTDVKSLRSALGGEGIEADFVESLPFGLRLRERKPIFRSKSFQEGLFEMQDGGSQLISEFVEVEPGHKTIDACAGAGGKSLHLAGLMRSKGRIIALDVHGGKLSELQRRARRAGISNLEARTIDSNKVIKRLHHSADRVLLDVPCTGSGVIRRNPDSKWRISPFEFESVRREQRQILSFYSSMVRAQGKLVYSTCSLFRGENQDQVREFLNSEQGKRFELEEEKNIFPSQTDFDGFYMARFRAL